MGLLAALAAPVLAQSRGEIRVKVVGLQSDQGELRWALYDKKDTFATKDGPIVKGARPIKNGQVEFVIPDVPYGTYAIIVGHDVNRDGKIDENPLSAELKGHLELHQQDPLVPELRQGEVPGRTRRRFPSRSTSTRRGRRRPDDA